MDWLEFGVDTSPDLLESVQTIALHLESLGNYDKATVVSLLSMLAHSPDLYQVVATGLESLQSKNNDFG